MNTRYDEGSCGSSLAICSKSPGGPAILLKKTSIGFVGLGSGAATSDIGRQIRTPIYAALANCSS